MTWSWSHTSFAHACVLIWSCNVTEHHPCMAQQDLHTILSCCTFMIRVNVVSRHATRPDACHSLLCHLGIATARQVPQYNQSVGQSVDLSVHQAWKLYRKLYADEKAKLLARRKTQEQASSTAAQPGKGKPGVSCMASTSSTRPCISLFCTVLHGLCASRADRKAMLAAKPPRGSLLVHLS